MKISELIRESPQSDRRMRDTALRVYKGLQQKVRWPLRTGALLFGSRILPIAYIPVLNNLVIAMVAGYPTPAFQEVGFGTIRRYPYIISFPVEGKVRKQIDLRSAHRLADKLFVGMNVYDLLRAIDVDALVHEFTHYWDAVRAGGVTGSDAYDQETKNSQWGAAYYNDHMELNAFFNQMAILVDQATPAYIHRPFREFLSSILKKFDPDMMPLLTQQNRQRILSRLYILWSSRQ